MLSDPYITSSNFRPKKSASKCDVKRFYEEFEKFYTKVRSGKNPDLPHPICDPYGFSLLCKDYAKKENKKTDKNISCQKSFEENISTENDSIFKYKFSFEILLELLYRAYLFDIDMAIKVYKMQHDAFDIFNQIMNGQGYVINKLNRKKKAVRKLMNHALNSKISLNENKHIDIPYKQRVCDGKSWPCIISKNYNGASIKKVDIGGYGQGIFLIGNDNLIYDVLKINDLWVTDTPLQNRLKFGTKCSEYELAPYIKAYSWRSALNAGRILGCNQTNGILVRPCYEDYFEASWFQWANNSLIYCCNIKGELKIANRQRSIPDYYTLQGDLGEVNPIEEREHERIWLDDFDIKEFKQILKLPVE